METRTAVRVNNLRSEGTKFKIRAEGALNTSGVALGVILDIKVIHRGGTKGKHRIVRHLWRMCFAFLLACISFFIGQPQIWPEAIQQMNILPVPVIAVFALMIFWVIRVLVISRFKVAPGSNKE